MAGELKDKSPNTKVYVAEPDNAPLLYSGIKTEYGDESAGELTTFKVRSIHRSIKHSINRSINRPVTPAHVTFP